MSQLCLLQCMMHNMETCWTCPGHCAQFLGDHCGPLPQNMSLMCCKFVGLFCGAPSVRLFNRGALLCAMCWLRRQFWKVVLSRPVMYFVESLCDRHHGNYVIACHVSVSLSVTLQASACVCATTAAIKLVAVIPYVGADLHCPIHIVMLSAQWAGNLVGWFDAG